MSGQQRGGLASDFAPRQLLRDHTAAVKALSWCPWQRNVLASGGGSSDRTIKIWNSSSAAVMKSVDTGSQVSAIQWSDTHKELISGHGFSDNQLILWKYSSMSKVTIVVCVFVILRKWFCLRFVSSVVTPLAFSILPNLQTEPQYVQLQPMRLCAFGTFLEVITAHNPLLLRLVNMKMETSEDCNF